MADIVVWGDGDAVLRRQKEKSKSENVQNEGKNGKAGGIVG